MATRSIKARPSQSYSPETSWEQGAYGCNVTVAVVDNGVDDEHPYLDSSLAAGKDVMATGRARDRAGRSNPQPLLGQHGTPVAGVVLSNPGPAFRHPADKPDYSDDALVGAAPCAHLVDVQFARIAGASAAPTENLVEAIEWATAHRNATWGDDDPTNDGIDVITVSYSSHDGTDGSSPVCQAASRAVEAGIVVVGSAGNYRGRSGSDREPALGCPGAADGALAVGNLDNNRTVRRGDDVLHPTSVWGPRTDDGDDHPYEELKPDVAAPGHGVVSTGAAPADGSAYALACFGPRDLPRHRQIPRLADYILPFCKIRFGGTSAAAPTVAGVAAMMLDANPALSPAGVRSILHQTADVHPDMERSAPDLSAKWDHRYGYGMVDAGAAVRMARSWPGLELGRDTDADGVRNPVDAGPRDPSVQEVEVPANLTPAGRQADTDGDGQVDGRDPHPLDPRRPGNTAALEGGSTGTGVGRPAASANSAPSPGAAAAVAVLVGLGATTLRWR